MVNAKFKREGWQVHDINHLLEYNGGGTANWSEMGCYKTSTGLWYLDRKVREAGITNPSILIVTSKAGKGTFFEAIPEILPNYTMFDIETQGLSVFVGGQKLKLPKDQLKFVPTEFAMPAVCLTHYNVFSKSNFGQFEEDPETGLPLRDENDKIIFKPWAQSDYIINREWDMMWCDEFHKMKDKEARWTVNIKKVKTKVGRHGSTGTGFINKPDEIWSLLNWLDRKNYGSYWKFREEYCLVDDSEGYTKIIGCKPEKKDEFRKLVRSIGVRRTLTEVMPHIKEPIFKAIEVDLNKVQRKMYDDIRMQLKALDQQGVELYAANVLSLLQRLRQICVGTPEIIKDEYDPVLDRRKQSIKLVEPSSKIDALMEIIEELRWDEDVKEPLVVFSNFKDPLELLKARLDKNNAAVTEMGLPDIFLKPYIHMEQKDNDIERYHKWHTQFPTLKYRVFMSTLQLGGESINLSPARHVVFLDRSWSPKDNTQGVGRIRRPGQEGQPVVININAKDTVDSYIHAVNNVKQGWYNEIFGKE